MTQYANIDKGDFFDRIETSDGYQIDKVGNNSEFDDKRKDTPDEGLKQDTAGLVNEIPNISFLDIGDTLLEDKKTLYDRRGAHLVVGKASKSIELEYMNKFKLSFEPNYMSDVDNLVKGDIESPYVSWIKDNPDYAQYYTAFGPLACMIEEDGRYEILHKEEIQLQPDTDIVCCYVDLYRKDANDDYQIFNKGGYAVSWWKGAFEKTFSGTTSGTDPNGSCSVKVSFKLGDILQKMPTWGYVEMDLLKGDILVLRMRDKNPDTSGTGEPLGNELTLEPYSNFISIKHVGYTFTEE